MRVIAVGNSAGGSHALNGFAPADLLAASEPGAPLPDGRPITNGELLTLECDYLVPAALSGAINSEIAPNVRARVVVEAANSPISPHADTLLEHQGVTVIPDILANAGGIIVSYFEWVQNLQQFSWTRDEVDQRLRERLKDATDQVIARASVDDVGYRAAAYRIATARVKDAFFLAGF